MSKKTKLSYGAEYDIPASKAKARLEYQVIPSDEGNGFMVQIIDSGDPLKPETKMHEVHKFGPCASMDLADERAEKWIEAKVSQLLRKVEAKGERQRVLPDELDRIWGEMEALKEQIKTLNTEHKTLDESAKDLNEHARSPQFEISLNEKGDFELVDLYGGPPPKVEKQVSLFTDKKPGLDPSRVVFPDGSKDDDGPRLPPKKKGK